MKKSNELVLIGYSGHSYVCADTAITLKYSIFGYCDNNQKQNNPFHLSYLGVESDFFCLSNDAELFISIGDNALREKIMNKLSNVNFVNLIHPSSFISDFAEIQTSSSSLISANVTVNAFVKVGRGVILNTACIVEHECEVGDFSHIAPGAVLAGNVKLGKRSFIGANAVVKQGVNIGDDVIVGAGSVIIKDIPNGVTVIGNPGKIK